MKATTTIFVTVYPTSPVFNGGSPGDSGSGQTGHNTLYPTTTVHVSPVNPAQTFPPPWTTITVDVWGTESDSGSGSNPATVPGGGAPLDSNTNGDGSLTSGLDSNVPAANPTAATGGFSGPLGPANPVTITANVPQDGSPRFTVVTDSAVQWVTGSDGGPSPVTILSEHTITLGAGPTGTAGSGESLTCVTMTGPDGRPTVYEWPISNPRGNNGGQPVSTAAGVPVDSNGNPVQGASTVFYPSPPVATATTGQGLSLPGGAGLSTACTTYTILGPDGIPTIVHSSWLVPHNVPATAVSGSLITGAAPSPTQFPNGPNGAGLTSRTTYTMVGPDGKPTVVESTLVLPGSQITQTNVDGNPPNGVPIQSLSVPGSPGPVISGGPDISGGPVNQGGVTTCTTYTVLGIDGRPTIVDKTYVIPGPLVTPAPINVPGGVITAIPPQNGGLPGSHQSGNAGNRGITTCITYTAIGPDGHPTIVESTVVMPASDAIPTASNVGFSPVLSQQPVLTQGNPAASVGSIITTAITVDILGPNGVATPVVETIVLTPIDETRTTLGYPSMAPQQMPTDLPQGIPPFNPSDAVTTRVTVDIVGPNGVVTPVVETIVLTPVAPGTGSVVTVPVAASTHGVPALDSYGADHAHHQTIFPPSVLVSGVDTLPTGVAAATSTAHFTIVTGANGIPVLSLVTSLPLPSYGSSDQNSGFPGQGGNSGDGQEPNGYGWSPSQPDIALSGSLSLGASTTAIQTGIWTNVIPEQTTTYTINFPFTTLATVAVPGKRRLRRQEEFVALISWPLDFANHSFPVPHLRGKTPRPRSVQTLHWVRA